ncbi:hypothetical protein [Erythrobacter sp. CCH5-A1]|jgi:hypothetical protein|uniref:hypothetical protein n=1 Tax=Erythrobacter sp. CCH5-A1 TaxID=1768792 RepID=UPI00082E2A9F|nr:hypothetical protein [Erythrobacter sp. CCH5-A1]
MRDKEKPFVMYRRGSGSFTIVPRGIAGWSQFAVGLAVLGPLVVWFARHVEAKPAGADFYFGVFLFCAGVLAWLIAGLWWMIPRAKIVDVVTLKRDREMAERKRQRQQ